MPEHRSGFDKTFIKAPCCCCPQCRKKKSNDWQVRAYYEFFDNHRQCFFVTLDFDDFHLPHYKGKPCFDSDKMREFFAKLRYRIGPFRYFYASDNSGLLARPHYHVMILPEKHIDKAAFMSAVVQSWRFGSHEDIELIPSVHGDKLGALKYIAGYTAKDITFSLDKEFQDLPMRYRHRVQASKHFGEAPLHDGRITREMLLKGQRLALPIGKNGALVQLPIPRYYEIKLAYDYTWHSELMKAELKKNDFGVQLAKARHNGDYVYFIKSLFSSRLNDFSKYYKPDNWNFHIPTWYHAVMHALEDFEDFKEFVYYRPFLVGSFRSFSTMFYDSVRNEHLYRPRWSFYLQVCSCYECFKNDLNEVQCKIESEELIRRAKLRALSSLKRNPQKYTYLRKKNFDFSKLNL